MISSSLFPFRLAKRIFGCFNEDFASLYFFHEPFLCIQSPNRPFDHAGYGTVKHRAFRTIDAVQTILLAKNILGGSCSLLLFG